MRNYCREFRFSHLLIIHLQQVWLGNRKLRFGMMLQYNWTE